MLVEDIVRAGKYSKYKNIPHICNCCGGTEGTWRLNLDEDEKCVGMLCKSCCDYLYYYPSSYPKHKEKYSKNRVKLKGKIYYLPEKTLTGRCTACPKNIFDGSCKRTLYYIRGEFDPNNILTNAVELCTSCHASRTNKERKPSKRNKFGMYVGKKQQKTDEEYHAYFRKRRSTQVLPIQDTTIEIAIQNELTRRGIKFVKHKAFYIRNFTHQVDIFIEPNICIECDGDYFHSRLIYKGRLWIPIQRDYIIDAELEKRGLKVIRLSEYDIRNNLKWCIDKILHTL